MKIEKLALSGPGVLGVHDLKAEFFGRDVVHAGMHIEVQSGMTVDEPNHIAEEVDQRVRLGVHQDIVYLGMDRRERPERAVAAAMLARRRMLPGLDAIIKIQRPLGSRILWF